MECPFCMSSDSKVIDSRDSKDSIRRRRECNRCGKRFTTYERIEMTTLRIVKKDGRREAYDRDKLRSGLRRACEKRPISEDKIDEVISKIEAELRSMQDPEIPSKKVGDLVMKHLKRLDKVAYIRFASVYRDFADITTFKEELEKLSRR